MKLKVIESRLIPNREEREAAKVAKAAKSENDVIWPGRIPWHASDSPSMYLPCHNFSAGNQPGSHDCPSRKRAGYVLVMTLVLLAIAATLVTIVGRRSAAMATSVNHQADMLGQRWLLRSIERSVLKTAEARLRRAEKRTGRPMTHVVYRLEVNGSTLTLALGDEQAKANVNRLWHRRGKRQTRRLLRRVRQAPDGSGLRLALSPTVDPNDDPLQIMGQTLPAFASYHQLFSSPAPDGLLRPVGRHRMKGPAAALTLWGDGRLHWQRSPRVALKRFLSPPLSLNQVQQLIDLRRDNPGISTQSALANLQLETGRRARLSTRLTDQSGAYSLWQRLETPTGQRHRLTIRVGKNPKRTEQRRFTW
jgi:hypothetical protein